MREPQVVNREFKAEKPIPKPSVRKGYVAPSLVIYGPVSGLTQSGMRCMAESWASLGTNRRPSERRVKENIGRIGEHPWGFGLSLFDYRKDHRVQWGHGRQLVVMIDEVEIVMPEAVSKYCDGYKRVDYGMLGISQHIQQSMRADNTV